MEKTIIFLDPKENPLTIRIIQIIFGFTCTGISVFWIIYNLKASDADQTLWITSLLLFGFGFYQILSGMGKTKKFIEIHNGKIILKKSSLLPKCIMNHTELKKIESYPLNINFYTGNRRKTVLRFGITYTEIIKTVKDRIEEFAASNNIPYEIKEEDF
ncbi:MAG TPA: hypothetical protein PL003_02510 [Bacteroidales bacterium]|nr:hypothetical protein [Bacteroidales bacterium]